jgi:hypothetical protein
MNAVAPRATVAENDSTHSFIFPEAGSKKGVRTLFIRTSKKSPDTNDTNLSHRRNM